MNCENANDRRIIQGRADEQRYEPKTRREKGFGVGQ